MEDITKRSDRELLVELICEHHTSALYNNKVRPLFCAETQSWLQETEHGYKWIAVHIAGLLECPFSLDTLGRSRL